MGVNRCAVLEGGSTEPCTKIIPTLGPQVYKQDLLWAIWIPRGQDQDPYSKSNTTGG